MIAYGLGEKPTMGSVEKLFSDCGRIAQISQYWPGEQMPGDVRQERERLMILPTKPLAVVEFSSAEKARKACSAKLTPGDDGPSLPLMQSPVLGKKEEMKRSPSPQPNDIKRYDEIMR